MVSVKDFCPLGESVKKNEKILLGYFWEENLKKKFQVKLKGVRNFCHRSSDLSQLKLFVFFAKDLALIHLTDKSQNSKPHNIFWS